MPLPRSSSPDAGAGGSPVPEPPSPPADAASAIVQVRKATVRDVPTMARIINHWASQGIMLAKSHHQLYQYIRDYVVATHEDVVIGCGALHVVWEDLAEVRSMAVEEAWHGRGVGRQILAYLLNEARELGLPHVFALTYRQSFFARAGFYVVPHESLPHKIWGDCLNCPKFPNCDEIAMTRDISLDDR